MLDNTIQWFSSFGTPEWLGVVGIIATIIVAILFRSRSNSITQKSKGNDSPNINANGNVTISHHEKD